MADIGSELEISLLRSHLTELSKSLVSQEIETNPANDVKEAANSVLNIIKGAYQDIVVGLCDTLLKDIEPDQVEHSLSQSVKNFTQDSKASEIQTLCSAVACLQLFVQANWLGPPFNNLPDGISQSLQSLARTELEIDGDVICTSTKYPVLLYIAKVILLDSREHLKNCVTLNLWLLRYVQLHQSMLDERSPTLRATAMDIMKQVSENGGIIKDEKYSDLAIQYHLECGHLCYFYYEPTMAAEHFAEAEKLSGINIELTGTLGRRTRFQQTDLPQLVMNITPQENVNPPWAPGPEAGDRMLPKNLRLDDDTVLDKLQLTDHQPSCPISGVQGATVLGLCYKHRRSREIHQILQEECEAFITAVLDVPHSWAVQTKALLLRSQWEWDSSRKVERAMSQLEELVNQHRRPEPSAAHRLDLFYSLNLPPIWQTERQLAALFEKLGAIQAALEVYLRIESWEDVIKCYIQVGKRDKADKLIREQLAKNETPLLWCYLGDIHNSVEHYQKSWEISNCRFGRAQRSMAYLHLHEKKYTESLPCFEKSLKLNGLQVGVWFSYGCAALYSDRFDLAAKAFRRCVDLDDDNFEAWSNLATAYIKSKQKPRAFLVLQEAIKCEYENWRLWENYLLVATDIGEFNEIIQAYHRLLDIRDKHMDIQVLEVLVKAIRKDLPDARGQSARVLRPKALELFGRITSKITTNGALWRMYAELNTGGAEVTQTDREKAVQNLQKCHRCSTQAVNWDRQPDTCLQVLQETAHLTKSYLECSKHVTDKTESVQLLSGAKLSVKGVLTRIKQKQVNAISGELLETLKPAYDELEVLLNEVIAEIESRKS